MVGIRKNKSTIKTEFEPDEIEAIHESIVKEAQSSDKPATTFSWQIKVLLAIFCLSIVIFWPASYYFKYDPNPRNIPTFSEVFSDIKEVNTIDVGKYNTIDSSQEVIEKTKYDYYKFIDLRDPIIKLGADRISAIACDNYDNYKVCQAKALFYFTQREFLYSSDPLAYEFIKTPRQSIVAKSGDCDDASVLLASFLGSVGISTRLVFVPGHVYVEAYLPDASRRYKKIDSKDYVALDATCTYCKFGEVPESSRKAVKTYLPIDI